MGGSIEDNKHEQRILAGQVAEAWSKPYRPFAPFICATEPHRYFHIYSDLRKVSSLRTQPALPSLTAPWSLLQLSFWALLRPPTLIGSWETVRTVSRAPLRHLFIIALENFITTERIDPIISPEKVSGHVHSGESQAPFCNQ